MAFKKAASDDGPDYAGDIDVVFLSYMDDVFIDLGGKTPYTWGINTSGTLGDNTIVSKSSPIQVLVGNDWKQSSFGRFNVYNIKTNGELWVCGYNTQGQLGDNSVTNKSSPVQTVAGGLNWKQISGDKQAAAIKTDGTLWCWGLGTSGQLGDNTIINRSSPVQEITSSTNWKQVSCGEIHTTAIKTNNELWTWGDNTYGQLGNETTVHKSSPIQTVAGDKNWKHVSASAYHIMALKHDSTLWAWGRNNYGQIGDNTIVDKSSPTQIGTDTNWKYIHAGRLNVASIKTDGTLWIWGENGTGALGDGSAVHKSSPVQTVAGGDDWKHIECGYLSSSAIKTDGTLWTWGSNNNGQLGDNSTVNKSSPVQTVTGGYDWIYSNTGRYGVIGWKI